MRRAPAARAAARPAHARALPLRAAGRGARDLPRRAARNAARRARASTRAPSSRTSRRRSSARTRRSRADAAPRSAGRCRSRRLPALDESHGVADEVRPVTILFADIVGSTALGERLAPEETKALVGECVTIMSRAVEEYGGTVQAYQGDGICAYFGVPLAHENDPERAALAGLRILGLMDEYTSDIERAWGISGFSVRVGINSGRAAVGLVGAAEPQAVALGDATNVAARVQASAEPGTILVGRHTARRLTHRFVLEPLGEIDVKGREAPVDGLTPGRAASREPCAPRSRPASAEITRSPCSDRSSTTSCSGRGRDRRPRLAPPGSARPASSTSSVPRRRARHVARRPLPLLRRPPSLAVHGDPPRLARSRGRRAGDRDQNEGAGTPRCAPRRRARRGARVARPLLRLRQEPSGSDSASDGVPEGLHPLARGARGRAARRSSCSRTSSGRTFRRASSPRPCSS